jgi:predicted DNA binding CopG/RHH family protein
MKKATGANKTKPVTLEEVFRRRPAAKVLEDIARLESMKDDEIDLSDVPEVTAETGWAPNPFYHPVTQAVTIRLNAPDVAMARALSRRKGMPYQTYIGQLLHGALEREIAELER